MAKPPKKPRAKKAPPGPEGLDGIVAAIVADAGPLPSLPPLALGGPIPWDPANDLWLDDDGPVPAWTKPIIARGQRSAYEMETVEPGRDTGEWDDGPIFGAVELHKNGDGKGARKLLLALLAKDARCLDAHAHLGAFAFVHDLAAAMQHYAVGAAIGLQALTGHLDAVVPWGMLENRPFLRCVHGVALCWWRLGRTDEAKALLGWMLWLDPNDPQGARLLLADLEDGREWRPEGAEPVSRSPRPLPRASKGRRSPASERGKPVLEWVGGFTSMPGYVTGEGEAFRPELLMFLDDGGLIVGSSMGRPGELVEDAASVLASAMSSPLAGAPRRPGRLRVSDPVLAGVLQSAHPRIEVIVAATPELDEVVALMRQRMGSGEAPTYFENGVTAKEVGALFVAAADFYRAAPWKTLAHELGLVAVTSEPLELADAAVSVMGQLGDSFGFVVFDSIGDFEAYMDAGDTLGRRRKRVRFPPHLSLDFTRGADLDPALRKEIAQHGWEVADAAAYPSLVAVDDDLLARPLTAHDLAIATTLCRALPVLAEEEVELHAAMRDEQCFELSLRVSRKRDKPIRMRVPFD